MPRAKISEFSTTAGDNTDIDGINLAEGCAPSGINDAIRELMAQLKDFQSGAAGDNITVVGTLAAKGTSSSGADLKLYEDTDNGTNYVGFIAPASIASNVQWTLPSADGSSGQALQTNGSGTLSFATLGISAGGTGQTTANAAFNALAPSQTSNAGRYLKTDGTNTSWDLLDISTADITGTLPVANGGTGITSFGTGVATALGQNVTGSGGIVLATSPTLVTPNLGTPSAVTLTNATGLPISTGVSGLGTGVATALAVNVGSSGAFVTNGGALGTPSSGTVTNLTGTASININGTVGATTPNTGSFTTLTTSSTVTINGGTANGVAYLNGSKVLTTGSALTFDGTTHTLNAASGYGVYRVNGSALGGGYLETYSSTGTRLGSFGSENGGDMYLGTRVNNPIIFLQNNSEAMRLTSTGLGIGTSSPAFRLDVSAGSGTGIRLKSTGAYGSIRADNTGTTGGGSFSAYQNGVQIGIFGVDGAVLGNTSTDTAIFSDVVGGGIKFYTNASPTPKAILDSSGNLGLGVTPSASTVRALQVSNNTVVGAQGVNFNTTANAYFDSSFKYHTTGAATWYQQSSGQHAWWIAPSWNGTGSNAISFTQAMTLDASGNFMVGATSSSAIANKNIDVNGTGDSAFVLRVGGTTTAYLYSIASQAILGTVGALPITFNPNGTERARITSGGNLLVGTTDNSTGNIFVINGSMAFNNGATIPQINYYSSASTIEYVNRDSGGAKTFSWYYGASGGGSPATLSTSGVWTNASDARGKENISDVNYGLATVSALKPRQYDVKSDGSHRIGFVAQELAKHVPEVVHVTMTDKEGSDWYGVDYGSITAVLVKAIQELKAQNDDLRARVAQLEAK